MKKITALFLAIAVTLSLICFNLTSCTGDAIYSEGKGELNVLCTTFAPFDFVREIGGDRVQVSILQDSGSDLHNYTPTAATLEAISKADIFIYIGGSSDGAWVDDAIRASGNESLITLCLMDVVEPLFASLHDSWTSLEHSHESDNNADAAPSIPDDHDNTSGNHDHENPSFPDGHNHNHSDHDHSGHDHGADEHIWTSLKNAKLMVSAIASTLSEVDRNGASLYKSNASAYIQKLDSLDREIEGIAKSIPILLFADRFPFVYMLHDYHIPYIAAFSGCSTEVNAGFETQIELIKSIQSNSLDCIFIIEGGSKDLAKAISNETNCKIFTLNSMQSVTRSDIISGAKYLDIMQKNIETLKEAYPWLS